MKNRKTERNSRQASTAPRVCQTMDGLLLKNLHAAEFKGVDVADQCRAAFEQGEALLKEHGFTLRDVTQLVCLIADADNFPACFPVFRQYFGEASPAMRLIWLKNTPRSAPGVTFDLLVTHYDEDLGDAELAA